jgi:hypothetical protein
LIEASCELRRFVEFLLDSPVDASRRGTSNCITSTNMYFVGLQSVLPLKNARTIYALSHAPDPGSLAGPMRQQQQPTRPQLGRLDDDEGALAV